MAAKRSHSEALLEEASRTLEPKKESKKRRVEGGEESAESKAARKARKQAKRDRRAQLVAEAAGTDTDLTSSVVSSGPASAVNGENDTALPDAKAEKRKRKEERRQRKELSASTAVSSAAETPAEVSAVEEESSGVTGLATITNGAEVKSKKEKKQKKSDHAVNGENHSVSTNGVGNGAIETTTTISDFSASGYVQKPSLTSVPQTEVDAFLTSQFVTITDPLSAGYRPIIGFEHLPTVTATQDTLFKSFKAPTPIQAAAWPFLLAGRDVVGVAETGSGKTIAFGLPCMKHVASYLATSKKGRGGVQAVIVSPTRELALQIFEQLELLTKGSSVNVVCIYGGVPKDEQRMGLKKAHIVVATPGRLNDFIQDGSADLSNAGYVVLDEADRMLDKGFEEDIRKIISSTAAKRQTAMFTATWPASIRDLAATFMTSPVKVAIGDNPSGDLRANTRVVQKVEVVDPRGKEYRLLQLLKQYQSGKQSSDRILVFCLYKKEAMRVENFIRSKGFRVAGIHGDLAQTARTAALESFKSGTVPLLVATDVAARGLDIPAVKLVINVTFPLTAEDYVHRIGRTGRAGKEGLAITLFTEHDKAQSGALINVLKAAKQEVPEELMKFGTTVKKKAHDAYGAFYKETTEDSKKATKITFV